MHQYRRVLSVHCLLMSSIGWFVIVLTTISDSLRLSEWSVLRLLVIHLFLLIVSMIHLGSVFPLTNVCLYCTAASSAIICVFMNRSIFSSVDLPSQYSLITAASSSISVMYLYTLPSNVFQSFVNWALDCVWVSGKSPFARMAMPWWSDSSDSS